MDNSTLQREWQDVSDEHAEAAFEAAFTRQPESDHDGFSYDAHDAFLRSLGYEYIKSPCSCSGSYEDGHEPTCGWGRKVAS